MNPWSVPNPNLSWSSTLGFLVCAALMSLGQTHSDAWAGSHAGDGLWLEPGSSSDIEPAGRPLPQPADAFDPVTGHLVRVAYIIPTNRTAQAHAIVSLRDALVRYQNWYRDQMERNGFGPKTFRYETETNGVTPRIYTVQVAETDSYLRADLWGRTISAASAAGVPVWTSKQVWWLIPEAHLQNPDGSISGGVFLGASFGSGSDPGVAMVGGDALARFPMAFLTNNQAYHNQILPEIGPYLLKQDVSFPWFEGTTFSSISSSVLGGALHEISHGFGQPHDFRNDNNANGNLMGNGLRGFRGAVYPALYPSDYTRVGYGSALALNVSRYFNPNNNFTDNTLPALTVTTSGTNSAVNGLLQISFSASDAGGLSAAWLSWKGDLVDEMALTGTGTARTFSTAYYDPGLTNQYTLSVFDLQGNKRNVDTSIIPRTGFNRAPRPFIKVAPPVAVVGQDVVLDATQSTDPDHSLSSVQVQWDLDGDGAYDTAPTVTKLLTNRFSSAGNRLIRARLTDPSGAESLSEPVALQVNTPSLFVSRMGNQVRISWPAIAIGFALESTPTLGPPNWQAVTQSVVLVGNEKMVTFTNPPANGYFRLRK